MRHSYCYILLALLAACPLQRVSAQSHVTYQQTDSLLICRLLQRSCPNTSLLALARCFIGVPYVPYTLEVNDHEELVVNTRQLDCTTFVETVTALKICAQQGLHTWSDYVQTLCRLRYRGGHLQDYPSRLHYFSDWIADKAHMQMVCDIQSPNPPFTALQHIKVGYMSTHPERYKALKAHPELVPAIRQQEQQLTGTTARYIPKAEVVNSDLLRRYVKDGDIIAITCNKPGLDIAHLGFAVWRSDGLHLLNASQLHGKVIEEPMTLRYYLKKHKSHTGIRIVRVNAKYRQCQKKDCIQQKK